MSAEEVSWYTCYDQNGTVVFNYTATPQDAIRNQPSGSTLVLGKFEYLEGRFVDGEFVPYSPEVKANKSVRPRHKVSWSETALDWIDERTIEEAWASVREDRNKRLASTDWVALPDSPVTGAQQALWISYRQALRDITNQPDPFSITWPIAPPV